MNAKDDEIDLSKEIKADRKEIGWSQAEVAKHLREDGIDIGILARWRYMGVSGF